MNEIQSPDSISPETVAPTITQADAQELVSAVVPEALTVDNSFSIEDELVPETSTAPSETTQEATAPATSKPSENVNAEDLTPSKPNALQTDRVQFPREIGSPDILPLPSEDVGKLTDYINNAPGVDMSNSIKDMTWLNTMRAGAEQLPPDDVLQNVLNREDSDFRQYMETQGGKVAGVLATNALTSNEEIAGEKAIITLLTHLKVGGLYRAPMWHSGFWITFKPAPDSELIDLNQAILSEKIAAGRDSYGLYLSNQTVVLSQIILDFAIRHIYNTSVKADEMPFTSIRDHLLPQDIPSFLMGFLSAQYPNGFQFKQSCLNIGNCNHVVHETLNLIKLQLVDNARLNDWQKAHMTSSKTNSRTIEQVKRYQEEMVKMNPVRRIINKGTPNEIAVTYKTPSVRQYFDQGNTWLNGMVAAVDSSIREASNDTERNNLINVRSKAEMLCQYEHWVSKIEMGRISTEGDGESFVKAIVDTESIRGALASLSSIDSIREEIIEGVQAYISDSTISIIGIPSYSCPVCKKPFDYSLYDKDGVFIEGGVRRPWVALDVLQVFTGLLTRRLSRINNR